MKRFFFYLLAIMTMVACSKENNEPQPQPEPQPDPTPVASFNISVGYYDEHTLNEYVNFKEVQQAINDVKKIIASMPNKKYKAQ
jgi:hypothetical protein